MTLGPCPSSGVRLCKFRPGDRIDDAAVESFLQAKRDVVARINAGEETHCGRCANLRYKEWAEPAYPMEMLDVGDWYGCNLSCSYCYQFLPIYSTFFSEEEQAHQAHTYSLFNDLLDGGYINPTGVVIVSTGETLLRPQFVPAMHKAMALGHNLRVSTNLTKYEKEIESYLEENRILLFVSPDAGTPETYARIKGRDLFDRVKDNMLKYSRLNPRGVYPKYICLPENCNATDRDGFLDLVEACEITKIALSYDNNPDHPIPSTRILDFYGEFKYLAGRRGLGVSEENLAFAADKQAAFTHGAEQGYRKCLTGYEPLLSQIESGIVPVGNGRLLKVIRANDQGLWMVGWAYDKQGRRRADDVVAVWRGRVVFAGVCRWVVDSVRSTDKSGFSFHTADKAFADEVLADVRDLAVYARFGDGGWYRVKSTMHNGDEG